MKANDACPAESTLSDLVCDRLSQEESDRLADHIGQCEACQEKLADAEAGADIASQLPNLKNTRGDSSHLQQAMKRAKSLRDSPAGTDPQVTVDDGELQAALLRDGYELLGMIGRGGMGIVYKAREQSLDRIVAVKVLSPPLASDASSRERFLREARAAAAVVHPNVITIHAVSAKPPLPYLVMEFVEGVSLQQQLDSKSKISIDNVVRIGRQIAAGLSAAHSKGVVHRDIKPGNILLNARTGKVLLGDFGLARAVDHAHLTRTGTIVGTPAYFAPEAVENPGAADHRADLFSLGVVLYAMCSGDSPFQADSLLGTLQRLSAGQPEPLLEKVPEVPSWLSDIVTQLLEKNPANRFQSAAEVREALGHGLKSQDRALAETNVTGTTNADAIHVDTNRLAIPTVRVNTKSATRSRTVKRKKRRSQNAWIYAGITAFVVLIAAIGLVFFGPDPSGGPVTQRGQSTVNVDARNESRVRLPSAPSGITNGSEQQWAPFVCMSADGDTMGRFTSLGEAIENQADGGRIEIHASGAIETSQCSIAGKMTIEAGEGFKPILVFNPDEVSELETMLSVEGNLVLTGIELRLPEHLEYEEASLIGVETTGSVKLIDCTLVAEGAGFCIFSESDLSIENCHIHAPESTVLELDPREQAHTKLSNCWVSGDIGFDVSRRQHHSIEITDCSLACFQILSLSEDHEHEGVLSINSRRSLYVVGEAPMIAEHEDGEPLDQQIRWVGDNNEFSGIFFAPEQELPAEQAEAIDIWLRWVQETGAFVENPFNIDLDELPELISDPNFRLSTVPKSKTISAGAKQDK